MALCEIPTRQSPVALVCPQDRGSIAEDPAHHADCLGSKAGDLTLALCRNGLGTRRRFYGEAHATQGRRNVIRGGFSGLPGQPGPGAGRRAARGYDWRLSRRQKVAWLWRKYQPGSPLSPWYAGKTADQSPRIRRIMLIALARKLAISLWRYVETGLVPDGAVMAKTTPHMAAAT